jgi:peroxiredoxin
VGDMAPDFTLKHFDGGNLKDVKLSDYRGKKNVVLAFYIFAFTGG